MYFCDTLEPTALELKTTVLKEAVLRSPAEAQSLKPFAIQMVVIPLGFKPKTFRTGICHSISLSIPLFMGIFGIPQKRICADFAPIRHC